MKTSRLHHLARDEQRIAFIVYAIVRDETYIDKLEKGNGSTPPIAPDKLDSYLSSHLIDPTLLRADKFEAFMEDRQKRLLVLIEQAMCKGTYTSNIPEEGDESEVVEDSFEVALLLPIN